MIRTVISASLLLFLTSCAMVVHGPTQDVSVQSVPPSAKVYVDYQYIGRTPLVTTLIRNSDHTVKLELDGYETVEMELRKGVSGYFWANIVCGVFLIGMTTDYLTESMYALTPPEIKAELKKRNNIGGTENK